MTIADTTYGKLEGTQENDMHVFRGIPFAKPPVGELRWQAPAAPQPWTGVREAKNFGPCAIQSTIPGDVGELIGIATHETNEDCLYLNIWTPNLDRGNRPVMVWIHGGGNTVGAGSQPRVHGERLARTGDIVVVTVNYRLGALGFLHAPELRATGNEALLDQVAALRWVRTNIENFGGNPDNVTVFGQSAGGFDIAQLMAMPAAEGCFDKAIPMSGSLTQQQDAGNAHETSSNLARDFGGFEKLREVPAERILTWQLQNRGARWAPTLDGEVLTKNAQAVHASGEFTRDMPLLIGHTRDESTLFTMFNSEFAGLDRDTLVERMSRQYGVRGKEAVECYETARDEARLRNQPRDVWAAVSTDRMFRIPAINTAEAHLNHSQNVWMYRFDHESPAHDGLLQSCHSLDIPFVWGTYEVSGMDRFCGTGEAIPTLSERLMASYLAFAHSGNPSTDLIDAWPSYDTNTRSTMCFADEVAVRDAPLDSTRAFWND